MPTVTYNFAPNQSVWVIKTSHCTDSGTVLSVVGGTVIRVRVEGLITGVDTEYDIRLESASGTTPFAETDVFVDIATAMVEYEIRIS